MALNTASATAKLRGLTARFDESVESYSPAYPSLATVRPSDGHDEQYAQLGAMPGVREWLGDRVFHTLRAADYVIKNKTWEESIEIDREDLEDDRLGLYRDAFSQLGVDASAHPDELLFEALVGGEANVGWDGQFFFDTDHAWGKSGSQSNDLTYDATNHLAVTEAEFRAAFHQARAAMLAFKRDNGKPWMRPSIKPLTGLKVLVPPALELAAHEALKKALVDGGETNIVLSQAEIITIPYLTSATKFYLLNVDTPVRPFIFQARKPLRRQMKGLDDIEFKNVKFMTEARYNVGYGAWWNAVLTTFN